MLAAPSDLIGLIDPWRNPEPARGHSAAGDSALDRAYRNRLRFRGTRFDVPGVRVGEPYSSMGLAYSWNGLLALPCALLALASVLLQWHWLLIPAVAGFVWLIRSRLTAGGPDVDNRDWQTHYRELYYLLTTSSLPQFIASFEDTSVGHDSGDDEAVATHLIARAADDLPTALLQAARLEDAILLGTLPPPKAKAVPKIVRPLVNWLRLLPPPSMRVRARYCALYDFFFFPQTRFHDALVLLQGESQG